MELFLSMGRNLSERRFFFSLFFSPPSFVIVAEMTFVVCEKEGKGRETNLS